MNRVEVFPEALPAQQNFVLEEILGEDLQESLSPPLSNFDTPQECFLAYLQAQNQIDELGRVKETLSNSFPPLDNKTLIHILQTLNEPIIFTLFEKNSDRTFTIEFTLFDLCEVLGNVYPIKKTELVGGIVFWLLKDHYLKNLLIHLGVHNNDYQELIENWKSKPHDIDVRIYASLSSKQGLEHCNQLIDNYIAEKLLNLMDENAHSLPALEKNLRIESLSVSVRRKFYEKRHTQYDKLNRYSTATLQYLELLIIEQVFNQSLFVRDALRLNITPLINALVDYKLNARQLIEDIDNKKIELMLFPESDFCSIWQVIIDRLTCRIRADKEKYTKINEGGWPVSKSLECRGHVFVDEKLDAVLLDTFRRESQKYEGMLQAPQFWLKKMLKNHLSRDFFETFALTFNACRSLQDQKEIQALWNGMRGCFRECTDPVVISIDELVREGVEWSEISALLHVKAFLHYNTDNNDPNFTVILTKTDPNHRLLIKIKESFLQLPFDPIEALLILSGSKNTHIRYLLQTFIYPKDAYRTKKLISFNWNALALFSVEICEKDRCLSNELRLLHMLQRGCQNEESLFIDDLPMILNVPRLKESIESISFSKPILRVIYAYNELIKNSKYSSELNLALALVSSDNESYVKKGASLFQSHKADLKFTQNFIKSLGRTRPDLAMDVLFKTAFRQHERIVGWMSICTACQQRKKNTRIINLPILQEGLLTIFPNSSASIRKDADFVPINLLKSLTWLFQALLEQEKITSILDLLHIAHPDRFKKESIHQVCLFWFNLSHLFEKNLEANRYLPKIWETFDALNLPIPFDTNRHYHEYLLKISEMSMEHLFILEQLCKEKFTTELQGLATSAAIFHFKFLCNQLIEGAVVSKNLAILKMMANSRLCFTQELSQEFRSVFSLCFKQHELIQDAAELLTRPEFETCFTDEDLFEIRLIFLNVALENPTSHLNAVRRSVKFTLDQFQVKAPSHQQALQYVRYLVNFLKVYELSDKPFIKQGIDACLELFFKVFEKEQTVDEAIEFVWNISCQNKTNRVLWLKQFFPSINGYIPSLITPVFVHFIEKLLSINPTTKELESLLNLHPYLDARASHAWPSLMDAIEQSANKELLYKGLDLLIKFIEPNEILHAHPELRANCWFSCIKGLCDFDDKKVLWVFEHKELFNEVFEHTDSLYQLQDIIPIIFESLKRAFKNKPIETKSYRLVFNILPEFLKKTIIKDRAFEMSKLLISTASTDDPEILESLCRMARGILKRENECADLQVPILRLFETILKINPKQESPVWIAFIDLLHRIKKKKLLYYFIPLIKMLGTDSNSKSIVEALDLFSSSSCDVLKLFDWENFSEAGILLLDNAIHNHLNESIAHLLIGCLNDNWMKPFFKINHYKVLLYSFIQKGSRFSNPYDLVTHNLHGLGYNSPQQNGAIKLVLDELYNLSILNQKIQGKQYYEFIQSIMETYNRHFKISKISNKTSILKDKEKAQRKINEWVMYFTEKLIDHYIKQDTVNLELNYFGQNQPQFILAEKLNGSTFIAFAKKCNRYIEKFFPQPKTNDESLSKRVNRFAYQVKYYSEIFLKQFTVWTGTYISARIVTQITGWKGIYTLDKKYPICFQVPTVVSSFSSLFKFTEPPTEISMCTSQIVNFFKLIFVPSTLNELIFRYGLQEVMLKRLTEKLVKKYAPSYEYITHKAITKIARIAIASTIYTLAHLSADKLEESDLNCHFINTIHVFAIGIFLGLIQEYTGDVTIVNALQSTLIMM